MCAFGYAIGDSGGMDRASRMGLLSVTIAIWVNVLACTSLMHLKTALHSLKEISRSVSSKGRPWLDRTGLVIGVKLKTVLLLGPLAVGPVRAVEAVGFVVPVGVALTAEIVDAVEGVGPEATPFIVKWLEAVEAVYAVYAAATPLTVEGAEAVKGVGPVAAPFTIRAVEAVGGVSPVVTPLTVAAVETL